MLTVTNVSVDYEGAAALIEACLSIEEGDMVALVGANGSGKSSLLAAITGLHRPIRGSIAFEGEELAKLPAQAIARRGIALVPEGRRLFPHLSVQRNLFLGAYRRKDVDRAAQLERVLQLFPVLAERAEQLAGTLSGGEQQMVAIGRALMGSPRLLILDEPSLGIAPLLVARIFSVIADIHAAGTTVLLVEQKLRQALTLADRAYVLQTGRIVLDGPAAQLLDSEEVRHAYLGL